MQLQEHNTFALQSGLALFCRTGTNEPASSIQEHTIHYRRLVFNVVEDMLQSAFPVTRKLIGKKRWQAAVSYFFAQHKCQTPQVWRLPQEFQDFYRHHDFPFDKGFLFLEELLLYEWLEIEVFMMEDVPVPTFRQKKVHENDIYVLNPEIRIVTLNYPLHLKDPQRISAADRGQYFVSIHRDYETKQVKFNELSYPFVEILVAMHEQELTKNDLVQMLMKYENETGTLMSVLDHFEQFAFESTLLLGYRNRP